MLIALSTLLPLGQNDHRLRFFMVTYSIKLAYLGVFIVLRQNIPFNIPCSKFYKPNCRPFQRKHDYYDCLPPTAVERQHEQEFFGSVVPKTTEYSESPHFLKRYVNHVDFYILYWSELRNINAF